MRRKHQVEIDDEDYERLRKHYGASWARGARRILMRQLDDWDREAAARPAVHVGPDYGKPLTGGAQLHGRYPWYVACRKIAPHAAGVVYSCVVYAEEDTRESAGKRARELLDLREWAVNEHSTQETHRGNDINLKMYPEGIG